MDLVDIKYNITMNYNNFNNMIVYKKIITKNCVKNK